MRKIKWALITILIMCSGCSGLGEFAAGAGAGGLLVETFKGAEADLERQRQAKLIEREAALFELDNTTDEIKKLALNSKIKALEETIDNLQDAQEGVQLAAEGTNVNWSDPEAATGYVGTVVAAGLAYYFRKKDNKSQAKYQAHKQGVAKTMKEVDNGIEMKLYNNIGEARKANGVS